LTIPSGTLLFLFFSYLLSNDVRAYSLNFVDENKPIRWSNSTQSIHIDTSQISSLSPAVADSIISDIILNWNLSHPLITTQTDQNPNADNKLRFSSSSLYLGPNVVGVTVSTHDLQSGSLIESEIIINDNFNFSSNPQSELFLGDVVSHELGHFWGLGHSQQLNSSMFYRLRKGQHVPHSDDIAGLKSLYPFELSTIGSISGQIIAGKNEIGVFGAHVTAISLRDGRFVASAITSSSGYFKIEGLPVGDDYFLYIDRLKGKENFSTLYREAKSDFCNSGFAYRGSFYQSCLRTDEGFPFATKLTSVSRHREVGPISIRCNLDVPTDYMLTKGTADPFDINFSYYESAPISLGESFVGFFTESDASTSRQDILKIDMSDYDLQLLFGTKDLYIEFDLLVDEFFSKLHLSVVAQRVNAEVFSFPQPADVNFEGVQFNEFLNPTTKLKFRVPLSLVDPTDNIYELFLTPNLLQTFVDSRLVTLDQYLVGHEEYADELLFYLLSFKVVERMGNGSFATVATKDYGPARNNLACMDANQAYDVKSPERASSTVDQRKRRPASGANDGALGCGLIAVNFDSNDGPKGPTGAAACLCLCLFGFLMTDYLKKRLVS
jgi:hypothetical protein